MTKLPVRFGSPEDFARLRECLRQCGYEDAQVNSLKVTEENAYPAFPDGRVPEGKSAPETLVGLFLREGALARTACEAALGNELTQLLLSFGLLAELNGDVEATVRLRPLLGVYVIFDLSQRKKAMIDDVVYPADVKNTLDYLRYLPATSCDDYLEACGGSGIAALLAAKRFAGHAYSFDIAERSTQFARFSAALSGLENFTAESGDALEPAGDRMFDRIAVHPPYVPVLRHSFIFHDGGEDGEQITRRHIEQAPRHLKPGGRMYVRSLGTDRDGAPFEQRVRGWLGEHEREFDVAVMVLKSYDPLVFVTQAVNKGPLSSEDMALWNKIFERDQIRQFLTVFIVLQKHQHPRANFTVRRNAGRFTGPQELHWLIDWETERAIGGAQMILASPLGVNSGLELMTNHVLEDGEWRMARQLLSVEYPFPMKCDIDPIGVQILPRLNGEQTGMDILNGLVADGVIGSTADPRRFAAALGELVSAGVVQVVGFEPPGPTERHQHE